MGHAGVGGHAGAPVDETMEPIEASEERNAAMETEVMKGDPDVESRTAHTTGVEIHLARSDRGMTLWGLRITSISAPPARAAQVLTDEETARRVLWCSRLEAKRAAPTTSERVHRIQIQPRKHNLASTERRAYAGGNVSRLQAVRIHRIDAGAGRLAQDMSVPRKFLSEGNET